MSPSVPQRIRLACAMLLVTLCVVLLAGCGESDVREPIGQEAVATRLAGLAQDGEWLGSRRAPVLITEYVDLQCPACAYFSRQQLGAVIASVVRPGRAVLRRRVVAATLPREPATQAALIAQATIDQDRFWSYTEIWLENLPLTYGSPPEQVAPDILAAADVALPQFEESLAQRGKQAQLLAASRIDLERTDGRRLPVVVVEGPGGRFVMAAPKARSVTDAVRRAGR